MQMPRRISGMLCVLILAYAQCCFSADATDKLFDLKKDGAYAMSFCPNTRHLYISFVEDYCTSVHWWDIDSGRRLGSHSVGHDHRCESITPSQDGKLLAIGTSSKTLAKSKVVLLEVETGRVQAEIPTELPVMSIVFAEADKHLYVSQRQGITSAYTFDGESIDSDKIPDADAKGTAWVITPDKSAKEFGLFCRNERGQILKLCDDPRHFLVLESESIIAATTWSGELCVWKRANGQRVVKCGFGEHPIRLAYDSKNRNVLVVDGRLDGATSLYSVSISAFVDH